MIKFFICAVTILILSNCSLVTPRTQKDYSEPFRVSWSRNLDPKYDTGNLPIALNWPLAYEGLVFIGDNNGYMRAYDIKNGRKLWVEKDLIGYHAAPTIYKENLLYGDIEGRLYSRHYLTGKLNYVVDLGASIETEPVVENGRMYVQTRNHKIFALDYKTGKILWAYKRSIANLTTTQRASRPLIVKNKLYVGFADGTLAAIDINEGVLAWESKLAPTVKFNDVDASPIWFNGNLLIGSLSGPLSLVNPQNGLVLRTLNFNVSRSPIVKDDVIYLLTTEGTLVELDKNLQVLKTKRLAKRALSSLVDWKGELAVSSVDGYMYWIKKSDFEILKKHWLGHVSSAVFGQMAISDDKLALMSSRQRLYIFE
ncbi:MAG: hypothetical protein COW00_03480 [Bdellovibrio sp. CG12_big_fil_rev_8_21_14_0_65_39_13]|nr:MAG: hypothetical protein COW78_10885 [Bdellovibrio sp. CG22_combo_CG10-13_8_21_14_all_39_27]PIQ61638.1 MAG: hypothetical protein COW00_03480 [Bdellovibrio sp. CG12_big_fil_rev_8_21_14_0_65_39_13]PIR35701.1 MAG: hypothetical protein COV37_07275 [Bdellovibrio sp. CG11_big_fil_rev_8_21_14_0_20_39_38]